MPGMSGLDLLPQARKGAARRAGHHDHGLRRRGDAAQGDRGAAPRASSPSRSTFPSCSADYRRRLAARRGASCMTAYDPRRRRRAGSRGPGQAEIPPSDPRRRLRFSSSRATASRRSTSFSARPRHRHGGLRHQHAAHGRADPARQAQERRRTALHHHRLGLRRHGQYPHRDESRRVRLSHQADRLRRLRDDDPQDARPCRRAARSARRGKPRPSARTPRSPAISRPISRAASLATRTRCARRRAAARDRDPVHRYRGLHAAGRSRSTRRSCRRLLGGYSKA